MFSKGNSSSSYTRNRSVGLGGGGMLSKRFFLEILATAACARLKRFGSLDYSGNLFANLSIAGQETGIDALAANFSDGLLLCLEVARLFLRINQPCSFISNSTAYSILRHVSNVNPEIHSSAGRQ